jgi:Xaa-Pro dipeptidase
MVSGFGEAIALRELAVHDTVIIHDSERGGLFGELAAVLAAADPQRIAINSGTLAVADGLSATQRAALEEAVGPRLAARMVSSTPLVQEWLP